MPTVQVTNHGELLDALAVLSRAPVTGWDLETAPRIPDDNPKVRKTRALDPFQNNIVLVQASDGDNTYVFRKSSGWEYLKPFLEDNTKKKIFHNGKFDLIQLDHHLGIRVKNIWDTMVAYKLITNGLYKAADLASVTWEYLKKKLDKSVAGTFEDQNEGDDTITDEQAAYGAQDVEVLIPIYYHELEKITSLDKVADLEMLVTPVLARMELSGVLIDKELWLQLLTEFESEERKSAARLFETMLPKNLSRMLAGWDSQTSPLFSIEQLFDGMSPSSNQQLGEVLNYRLEHEGYKVIREKRKWNKDKPILPATSQKEVALFRAACRDNKLAIPPYIEALLTHRKWQKTLSSFGTNLISKVSEDYRLHPYFNQLVATGRMSCRNPNLQQIPKRDESTTRLRKCFISSPGKVFIVADYSQIELRLLAEMAREPKMIEAFKQRLDLHKRTVSIMKGIPIDDVTKLDRTIYKQIGFGIPYGLGAFGLALKLDVPQDEAAKLRSEYLDVFTELKKWLQIQEYTGVRDRRATTLLGRYRYLGFSTREDEDGDELTTEIDISNDKQQQGRIKRIATNQPIQGSAADMMKYAMVFIDEDLRAHGQSGLSLQVHDEVIAEVDEGFADEGARIVRNGMMRAGEIFLKVVPCDVEVSVRRTWGE